MNGVAERNDSFSNGPSGIQGFGTNEDPFASSKARDAFGESGAGDPFASAFDAQPAIAVSYKN